MELWRVVVKLMFLLFTAIPVRADWTTDPKVALEFLKSIRGEYESKNCRLVIEVAEGEQQGLVGHILGLRTSDQPAEFYIPLDFRASPSRRTRAKILNGRRMVHYEYYDRNEDPGVTEREVFLFEAVKTNDLSRLEYVEFGVTKGGRRVQWMVCRF
jgi:hypothetical protein